VAGHETRNMGHQVRTASPSVQQACPAHLWLGFDYQILNSRAGLQSALRNDWKRPLDRGTYWLHALEDVFSIEYVSRLWGTSKEEPWPEKVLL